MKIFKRRRAVDPILIDAAIELRSALEKYSKIEPEAEVIRKALEPMFNEIISGSAKLPIRRVPYSYNFTEGTLRNYSDLENVYSKFALRAEGCDLDRMNRFFDRLENDPKFAARMDSPNLTWWEKLRSMWSRGMYRLRRGRFK